MIRHNGEIKSDTDSEDSYDSEKEKLRQKEMKVRKFRYQMDQHCKMAIDQYRWAMLEASRHLSMDHKNIKFENKRIQKERLEELKDVRSKIVEIETGKKQKRLTNMSARSTKFSDQKEDDLRRLQTITRERHNSIFGEGHLPLKPPAPRERRAAIVVRESTMQHELNDRRRE